MAIVVVQKCSKWLFFFLVDLVLILYFFNTRKHASITMADYWKLQPKKFCQYCKCWITDNKPSIDFYEKGKNHKENVAAKISEIKKKSIQKYKQEERASEQFAAMEEAAVRAYEEDLKRREREAAFGPDAETTSTTSIYQPLPMVQAPKQPQANKQEPKQKKPQKKSGPPRAPAPLRPQTGEAAQAALWVEGKTDQGYTYHYNTFTGESRWDKPEDPRVESSSAQAGTTETPASCVWTEAVSPEGYTHYHNSVTGESIWKRPADSTNTVASGKREGQEEQDATADKEKKKEVEGTWTEAQAPKAGSKESTAPKIEVRKRKAETHSDQTPKESEEMHKQEVESGTPVSEGERPDETTPGTFRPPNPYGTWKRIEVQKDPYADVDWQLPRVQAAEEIAPVEVPTKPKHKFKTRMITSLGGGDGSSAPVMFKKKTQSRKSQCLWQRDEDD
ncbi:WW domain-binding protein 4-like [Eucyclogobius newberryi]|uniref:WW domain-binding protein 4-like n=1 Tax=Eucyclogobius newberryi TaxID=166745 RepID=UPI003B5CBC34